MFLVLLIPSLATAQPDVHAIELPQHLLLLELGAIVRNQAWLGELGVQADQRAELMRLHDELYPTSRSTAQGKKRKRRPRYAPNQWQWRLAEIELEVRNVFTDAQFARLSQLLLQDEMHKNAFKPLLLPEVVQPLDGLQLYDLTSAVYRERKVYLAGRKAREKELKAAMLAILTPEQRERYVEPEGTYDTSLDPLAQRAARLAELLSPPHNLQPFEPQPVSQDLDKPPLLSRGYSPRQYRYLSERRRMWLPATAGLPLNRLRSPSSFMASCSNSGLAASTKVRLLRVT